MTFTLTTKQLEKLLQLAIHNYEDAMEEEEMDEATAMQIAVDTTVEMLREDNTTFPRPTSPARPCTACDGYGYSGNGACPVCDGIGFVGSR